MHGTLEPYRYFRTSRRYRSLVFKVVFGVDVKGTAGVLMTWAIGTLRPAVQLYGTYALPRCLAVPTALLSFWVHSGA